MTRGSAELPKLPGAEGEWDEITLMVSPGDRPSTMEKKIQEALQTSGVIVISQDSSDQIFSMADKGGGLLKIQYKKTNDPKAYGI